MEMGYEFLKPLSAVLQRHNCGECSDLVMIMGYGSLKPLSTLFQLHYGNQFFFLVE